MEEVKLDVQVRNELGTQKVKVVRNEENMVPGIVYGGEEQPVAIKFDRRTYEKIRRQHHGEIVFHLNVQEGDKKLCDYSAVVKEEQHHVVNGHIIHIDFKRISLKEKIEVKVPLIAEGDAVGVKLDGGSLDHLLWELDIICLPTDIPEGIKIDISGLEMGASIHVKDVTLPTGVVTHHDPEAVIFTVVQPMKEEESTDVDTDAEPELIKKEKAAQQDGAGQGEKK